MNITEEIINKLFKYYDVTTIKELSTKIDIKKSTISNWKQRSAINPLRKKCKEIGIYKEIFEDIDLHCSKTSRKDINVKLSLFNRRSLIYFYYIIKKHNFTNAYDYFSWNIKRDEENSFKTFISDFFIDFNNNNMALSFYREETNRFIDLYLNVDELDYIFQNKEIFMQSILFIADQKR